MPYSSLLTSVVGRYPPRAPLKGVLRFLGFLFAGGLEVVKASFFGGRSVDDEISSSRGDRTTTLGGK